MNERTSKICCRTQHLQEMKAELRLVTPLLAVHCQRRIPETISVLIPSFTTPTPSSCASSPKAGRGTPSRSINSVRPSPGPIQEPVRIRRPLSPLLRVSIKTHHTAFQWRHDPMHRCSIRKGIDRSEKVQSSFSSSKASFLHHWPVLGLHQKPPRTPTAVTEFSNWGCNRPYMSSALFDGLFLGYTSRLYFFTLLLPVSSAHCLIGCSRRSLFLPMTLPRRRRWLC